MSSGAKVKDFKTILAIGDEVLWVDTASHNYPTLWRIRLASIYNHTKGRVFRFQYRDCYLEDKLIYKEWAESDLMNEIEKGKMQIIGKPKNHI